MSSVSFERVTKRFVAGKDVVKDLSLKIADQEFMVLVGPSGCGKTTALRMLAGLEDVTSGTIRIGDRVINDVSARDRDVAMVFQSYALYPHLSVFQNMAFGLEIRGEPKREIEVKVGEAAKMLGLQDHMRKRPRELSGGQRQRVALGRAIVRHPAVFLLDEPLSNLDAQLRVETRFNLQKLHARLGTTFIYVTHDQVEAMTMGDRIAVMREGVLQQVAPPRELYNSPANMYVAGFIGTPQMNFVPVTVSGQSVKASGFTATLGAASDVDKAVMGIRPEALHESPADGEAVLDMKVDLVEMLGPDQFIHGDVGADRLIARVEPSLRVAAGDRVRLGLNARRLHLFDPDTQRAMP